MLTNVRIKLAFSMVIVLSVMLAGCGGGSKSERRLKDGRIFVQNDVGQAIVASYLDEELGEVDTTIEAGETKEVTRHLMKGGTTVKLAIDVPGSTWRTLNVDVKIDGNVTMRVYTATAWGAGELGYEMR